MLIGVRAPTYNHLIYHVGAPLTDSRADIHGREFVGFEQIRRAISCVYDLWIAHPVRKMLTGTRANMRAKTKTRANVQMCVPTCAFYVCIYIYMLWSQ